ncbi:beta-lactamase regulator AmpE [Shewanella avicenniae]|uniref:Beta-lactamase regulator AmpE n=1 Tax=Shewanella avicenniae TaxID=2814294 RepID=A0ABX7QTL2_9GAMM|nr:beta-lactamase regulator AmpE [Shewanella avicenniae]QSX34013.1 beta-lactamase regulator AmpE [Shewanella avicenniae]
MALFSLLIAVLIERLKFIPKFMQLDSMFAWYRAHFFTEDLLRSKSGIWLALLFPALSVLVLQWVISGWLFGLPSLLLWTVIAALCLTHQAVREKFKQYMQAACRGDLEACYLHAKALDYQTCLDSVSAAELGARVGQLAAWLNYRYYGAIAFYLIILGPAGVMFYCTARYFADLEEETPLPLPPNLMFALDWLPSRVVSLGYALSGHFASAFGRWRELAFKWDSMPNRIVAEVALAAEALPERSGAPVCVRSTLALLALSKRNFILILTALAILTIFGLVQ